MSQPEAAIFADSVQRQIHKLLRSFESCDTECLARYGVTAAQGYALLAFPEESSVSMNQLSQSMGLANSTMTRMVDQLVAKGLVHRRQGDEDRRVVRVALTAQGQGLRHTLEEARRELLRQILGDMKEGEWPTVLYSLEKLNEAVERVMKGCRG